MAPLEFKQRAAGYIVGVFALLSILSSCVTSSNSKTVLPERQTFLGSYNSNETTAVKISGEKLIREVHEVAARLIPSNDQKLYDLIWLVDKILFLFVIFMSVATIAFVFFKEREDKRRLRILTNARKNIQRLTAKGLSVFKKTFPQVATKISPKQFLEMTKDLGTVYPEELEQYFRDFLLASGKIPAIERRAKKERNKWRRVEAITFLGYINSPATLGILKDSLFDKDAEVSYFSMLALARIKTRQSAAILLDFLGKHASSGYKIVSLLESFPPSVVDEIIRLTESPDPKVRFWAIKLLSKFKPKGERQRIADLTEDPSPDVRASACECLGILGEKEAKAVLMKCLQDKIWFVRMQAVRALSKIAGGECFPELLKLMSKDSSPFVKESVKNAIIGDINQALPYIEECLESGDKTVKEYCVNVLIDSNYIAEILGNVLSKDPTVRKRATRLLERMIKSNVYFGLKKNLDAFSSSSRDQLMQVVARIDENLVVRMNRELTKKA